MSGSDIDQFERAFSMHISGPVAECECGRLFFDTYNSGYDWADGEVELLHANPMATGVPHGVERIELNGRVYCMDCDCWHQDARRVIDWLRENQSSVGEWFRLERARLLHEATEVPQLP